MPKEDADKLELAEAIEVEGHQWAGMDIWHLDDGRVATICHGSTLTAQSSGELVEQYGLEMQAQAGDPDE